MKIRKIAITLILLLCSGCLQSTLNLPPDKDKIAKIEAGTLENSVRIIAGEPDRIVDSKLGYRTFYYREGLASDCKKNLQTCIPIVIERGKVAAVGRQWSKAWKRERRKRTTAYSRPITSSNQSLDSTATNREKIAALEKKVKSIPVSRTVDNLTIYRYLLKLDPDNKRYMGKVAFYEQRFEEEKNRRVAAKKQLVATRKWQNAHLEEFKGDPPVQMATKILGHGKFYVWLKNIGGNPLKVTADQFYISCREGKRYTTYSSKDFDRELKPGATIEGRVTFNINCDPREIIYANPGVTAVSRRIPVPDSPSPAQADETKWGG